MDYSFAVSVNPSEVAFAAILNSLAGLSPTLFGQDEKDDFIKDIESSSGLDHNSERIKQTRDKLWALYQRSSQYKVHDVKNVNRGSSTSGRQRKHQHNIAIPLGVVKQSKDSCDSPVCICSSE